MQIFAYPQQFTLAERVGFEPTVARKDHNGFRDRPDNPLWHLSVHMDYTGDWGWFKGKGGQE